MIAITTPVGVPEKKRRRLLEVRPTRADVEGANLRTEAAVAAFLGRRVRVFLNPRVWGSRGGGPAPRTAGTPTVVIRVIFPDGYVMEARFERGETVQQLVNLVGRAVCRPDLSFYLYTAPPKLRIVDMGADFRTAGLVPGANVYFCWDSPATERAQCLGGPCLRDEVRLLQWLDLDLGDI